jgi:hypothetical protein
VINVVHLPHLVVLLRRVVLRYAETVYPQQPRRFGVSEPLESVEEVFEDGAFVVVDCYGPGARAETPYITEGGVGGEVALVEESGLESAFYVLAVLSGVEAEEADG